jgi:hypothetical protein
MRRRRHLTKRGALKIAPARRSDALIWALQYDYCQVDDARTPWRWLAPPPASGPPWSTRRR